MLEGIKGLLFDYGGTLDTDGRHWAHVLWEAYQQAKIPVSHEQFREAYVYGERALAKAPIVHPEDTFRDVLRKKVEQQFDCLSRQLAWTPDESERQDVLRVVVVYAYEYARRHTEKSCAVLHRLKERYSMVLVSNFYGNLKSVLQDFGLLRCFKVVIDSSVVGVRKPDPQIFQLAIEQLGFSPKDIAIVGDSYEKDIQPALSLGCQAIWFRGDSWDADKDKANDYQPSINNLLQVYEIL
jgi:putative hydrolase of the HAD superfamily